MNRTWISFQIAVCSFAAVWLPFYIGGRYLGYDGFAERLNGWGGLPAVFGFSGLLLILIDLWSSEFSNDDKFWWTVLGGIMAPVAIPAYWFCYGLEHSIERWRGRLGPTVSLDRKP
ncbi:MAG: hypothetical protein JJU20_09380 [Opitutales bacterium]|nr:hypothetical protein [Opitutales bacterium]